MTYQLGAIHFCGDNSAMNSPTYYAHGCQCICHKTFGNNVGGFCWCNCHSKDVTMRLAVDNDLRNDVDNLKKEVQVLRETLEKNARRRPYSCPLCADSKTNVANFDCKTCEGRGIVWG